MLHLVEAVRSYHSVNNAFPTGTWPNPSLAPESRLSWYALILPQLDDQEVYNALEKDQPWDAGGNGKLSRWRDGRMICPWSPDTLPGNPAPTVYIGIAGLGTDAPSLPKSDPRSGVFGYDRQTTLADIKDGAAYTMMLAETAQLSGSWLQGGSATVRGVDASQKPYVGRGRQFGGLHSVTGAPIAMADGSARWVSDSIDPLVFEALSTMAAGELLPRDW
jgi:hypothetical protein